MKILGIDIGLNGGISSFENGVLEVHPIPTMEVMVGKKMRNQYDINKIVNIITNLKCDRAYFERLRAIPGQRSQTAFSMGGGTMLFKTICTILKIPFIEIEPREWQKNVFGELGVQYDSKTTKLASMQACKQLFPTVSFLKTVRSSVDNDGMTDSACIAYYGHKRDK